LLSYRLSLIGIVVELHSLSHHSDFFKVSPRVVAERVEPSRKKVYIIAVSSWRKYR
jgi:hypothetical protein